MTNENNESILKALTSKGYLQGISSGFPHFDSLSGGLKEGELAILAASTGVGKSLLGLNILVNLAKQNVPSVYFDLENGIPQSFERLVRIWGSHNKAYVNREDCLVSIDREISEFRKFITYYPYETIEALEDDKPQPPGAKRKFSPTLGVILSLINVLANTHRVFLIDPLQVLEERVEAQEAFNEQGLIVRELKEMAQRKKITVILCHHMRKSIQGGGDWVSDIDEQSEIKYRVPTLDSLRGSSKIGDIATDVWGLTRTYAGPTKESRGKCLLRILKNRTGGKGDIRMFLDEDTLVITEQTPDAIKYQNMSAKDVFSEKLEG